MRPTRFRLNPAISCSMLTTSELVIPSKLEHLAEEFGSLQEPVEQLKRKSLGDFKLSTRGNDVIRGKNNNVFI